jgi:hypothetical protein
VPRARNPAGCLLALAIAGSGCASRETQASRDAWGKAVRGAGPKRGAGENTGEDRKAGAQADPSAWRDLASFTVDTAELVALGVSTVPIDALVAKLCAEPPDETPGALAPESVRCPPKPTMEPLGHTLTLELGRQGTVGLVAPELSARESSDLLALALKHLAGACAHGWTRQPGHANEEFHTCTARSGAMVVLGRFLSEGGGERWQFSLAVLGPG